MQQASALAPYWVRFNVDDGQWSVVRKQGQTVHGTFGAKEDAEEYARLRGAYDFAHLKKRVPTLPPPAVCNASERNDESTEPS